MLVTMRKDLRKHVKEQKKGAKMGRYITKLEVSQKQAYIFSSNRLKDNILNSAVIDYVLGPKYLSKVLRDTSYSDKRNMVYAGGGHTILEFADKEEAKQIIGVLTERIYRDFDGLSVFAKTIEYAEGKSVGQNLRTLTKELERKEYMRSGSFYQGSYGIEETDVNTLDVVCLDGISEEKESLRSEKFGKKEREKFYPSGYNIVSKFEELGGEKEESNFIAVVHIDGNGMGKRVENLYHAVYEKAFKNKYDCAKNVPWEEMKEWMYRFSNGIDQAFKDSFKEMTTEVGRALEEKSFREKLSLKKNNFPVRHVITAGDDVCFVTEGRIGLECARIFLEKLGEKKNFADDKGYNACAGVAIVHTKYPFYRAYELAEKLCANAKKFNASISKEDNGGSISSIDWHIEFGEIGDSVEDIRGNYVTADGNALQLRPYIIRAPKQIIENNLARRYDCFQSGMECLINNMDRYGAGKIKELRNALKNGEAATRNYLTFYRMEDLVRDNSYIIEEGKPLDWLKLFTGTETEIEPFITLEDGKKHSVLYDMIELMDTYLPVKG